MKMLLKSNEDKFLSSIRSKIKITNNSKAKPSKIETIFNNPPMFSKIWAQMKKVEAIAQIPLKPFEEENDDDKINWDEPLNPDDFIGFYNPENAN